MGLFIGNVCNATGNCHVLLSWSQCFQFSRKYNEKRREQNGASHINHLWNRFCICGSLCSILLLQAGVRSSKSARQTKRISSDEHICRERGCFRSPKPCCTCRFHADVLSFLFRVPHDSSLFVLYFIYFFSTQILQEDDGEYDNELLPAGYHSNHGNDEEDFDVSVTSSSDRMGDRDRQHHIQELTRNNPSISCGQVQM